MSSQKDPNNEVDLSKFFDREQPNTIRPATIQPMHEKLGMGSEKKQGSLVWIVVANFVIGMALFSFYIIKSNVAATVKPVSMQEIAPPVNYTLSEGEKYMLPLP